MCVCVVCVLYIYMHTHNGLLLIHKKNEILSLVTTWMDFEGSILGEISQKEKDKCHMISLVCGI